MNLTLELLSYLSVIAAVYGSYLNSKMDIRGFYFWFVSNWWFIGFNLYHTHYAAALLNTIFQGVTIYGIYKWSNKNLIKGDDIMADFNPVISYQSLTIASSATTSGSIDLQGYSLVGLIMPAAFTGTAITFQLSDDDATYYALYNTDGTQLSTTVSTSRAILFTAGDFVSVRFLKLVSGSTEGGSRIVKLILRKLV